jgi:hypothetical protein
LNGELLSKRSEAIEEVAPRGKDEKGEAYSTSPDSPGLAISPAAKLALLVNRRPLDVIIWVRGFHIHQVEDLPALGDLDG